MEGGGAEASAEGAGGQDAFADLADSPYERVLRVYTGVDAEEAEADDPYAALDDFLAAHGLGAAHDGLDWPVALQALPDSHAGQLRAQIDAIVRSAVSDEADGLAQPPDIAAGQRAVSRLRALLLAKEGEIPQASYQEAERYLHRVRKALADLTTPRTAGEER
jgi:hypothetical protein